jgi:syntaxin 1B/2/3
VQSRLLASDSLNATLQHLEDRHVSIRNLEHEVLQINELFRDMATLVDVQQESLNVIDKRIVNTEHRATDVHIILLKAESFQDKVKKYRVCLCLLLLVVLAAILTPSLLSAWKRI